MTLYIGNLPKEFDHQELELKFKPFGNCAFRHLQHFSFVGFKN